MKLKASIIALLSTAILAAPALAETEVETTGGLKAVNGDDFSFKFGGRIQLDAAYFDEDTVPMGDGFEFRRARLFAEGTLYRNWDYKAQYDFAGGEVSTKDLFIKYTGFESGDLTIGHFKQPFGLEELTSSKYGTFMERSVANVFATSRRIGVGYNMNGDSTTFAASVYGQGADADIAGDEGMGIGARFTIAPMKTDTSVFHLGVAIAQEEAADSAVETIRFRERPEAHLAERLVDTGDIDFVDGITKAGVEVAYVAGPFSAQAEYMMADVARMTGSPDVSFDGMYGYVSYFLDGETSRSYKNGSFGRTKGSDVWELALRYSTVSLDDISNGIAGGELSDITIGANYYVNPHLRFMINYVMAEADYGAATEEPNVLEFRASFDF